MELLHVVSIGSGSGQHCMIHQQIYWIGGKRYANLLTTENTHNTPPLIYIASLVKLKLDAELEMHL